MPTFRNFVSYLKKHPHYIATFIIDICHVWLWRIIGQPIVVITTESGGLGDYLWFRSYYSAIREHYSPLTCRIIVIGMCQWTDYVMRTDSNPSSNHFDIFRPMESPDHPLKIELFFFKLFKASVFVDFRARHLNNIIRAKDNYFGKGYYDSKKYYEYANNDLINKWFSLPESFRHSPQLIPIVKDSRIKKLKKPYVVVAEKGNTQGKLSLVQTSTIVNTIISKGYNVFFNGDYESILNIIPKEYSSCIIDGYTFPLEEYATIIKNSIYVVTVNTFIYHIAIQLQKPTIVLSANEYESIKLDAFPQVIVFNKELQEAYNNQQLYLYKPNKKNGLQSINKIILLEAIEELERQISK